MGRIVPQRALLFLMIAIVGLLVCPESAFCDRDPREMAGIRLAFVDSLLESDLNSEAVEVARSQWEIYGDDLLWRPLFENRLAIALLRNGQPKEALPFLENLVIHQPLDANGHRNLGSCLVVLGRKGRALSEYQVAVELEPRNYDFHREYGQLLLDFRIFDDALGEILTAASLCGDCLEIQPLLGEFYLRTGKPDEAVGSLERIWVAEGTQSARIKLLKALLDSGQDQAAVKLLEKNEWDILNPQELQQLIAAEGRLKQLTHSSFFEEQLADGAVGAGVPVCVKEDPVFWGLISFNLMNAGMNQEALTAVNRAIAFSGDNVVFLNNRVVLLQRLGHHAKAEQEWKKLLLLDPSLVGGHQ